MPRPQLYRLRTRSDREVIREVEPGSVYVDRETGEEFEEVGKALPLAPPPSNPPRAAGQRAARGGGGGRLRLCGCSLRQLTPKDVNACLRCGRRLRALEQ